MGSPGHTTDRCFALRHKIQDLREQHLLRFELEKESKPNVIQNPLPPHGNSNSAGPSSNEISSKNRLFDPSQLITPPGTKVHLRMETENDLPEINMVRSAGPSESKPSQPTGTTQHQPAFTLTALAPQIKNRTLRTAAASEFPIIAYSLDGSPIYQGKTESGHIWWDICDCDDCFQNAQETDLELEAEKEENLSAKMTGTI